MSIEDRERWDAKYLERNPSQPREPSAWLRKCISNSLPGRACDLACGAGENAILLAQQGWEVDAVDVSAVGLRLAETRAQTAQVSIHTVLADIDSWKPPAETYDLICVFRFLDRIAVPRIVAQGLKPGGILIYETFGGNHLQRDGVSMRNPDFVLKPGELPLLFPDLEVIESQEVHLPDGDFARFIGRRAKAP